jgi:2-furoate---CoA ligase
MSDIPLPLSGTPMTLPTLVELAVSRTPDQLALVEQEQRYTYSQLHSQVCAQGNALSEAGVAPGERVITVLPTSAAHALLLLAIFQIGAVAVPINPRLKPDEVAYCIEHAQARAVCFESRTAPVVLEAVRKLAASWRPRLLAVGSEISAPEATPLDVLARQTRRERPAVTIAPTDLSLILYTSGTTGRPKGVTITHAASVARVMGLALNHGLTALADLRVLGLMPLFHTVGLHGVFLTALALNGTYYPLAEFQPARALQLIQDAQIDYLFGSPTHFHALLSHPASQEMDLSSLKHVLYAGAPMPTPLLLQCSQRLCSNLTHIYGNTETYNSLFYRYAAEAPQALVPGVYHRVRVVSIGGAPEDEVPVEVEGELIVDTHSPESFSGYWRNPAATARYVRDGWYYTGDVCLRDRAGHFFIVGRADDMIISGAENIHPAEVEEALLSHPGVEDAGVVGVPDLHWGQRVVAFIERCDPALTAEELDRHCQRHPTLATFKRPRQYVFVEKLPRNPSGKLLRFLLREQATQSSAVSERELRP